MLIFLEVSPVVFYCVSFFVLHSCCTIFILHCFSFSVLHSFHVAPHLIAIFACCIFFAQLLFVLYSFHVAFCSFCILLLYSHCSYKLLKASCKNYEALRSVTENFGFLRGLNYWKRPWFCHVYTFI